MFIISHIPKLTDFRSAVSRKVQLFAFDLGQRLAVLQRLLIERLGPLDVPQMEERVGRIHQRLVLVQRRQTFTLINQGSRQSQTYLEAQ